MTFRPTLLLAVPLLALLTGPALAQRDLHEVARTCINSKTPPEAVADCSMVIDMIELLGRPFARGYLPEQVMAGVYGTRGSAYMELDKLDDALRDLDASIAIMPLAGAYYQRGKLHALRDRPDAAITELTRAIELGLDRRQRHAMALKLRGVAYLATLQRAKAIEDFRRAIEIDEKDADTHALLGLAFERIGDSRLAILSYRAALFVDPKHGDALAALERLGLKP